MYASAEKCIQSEEDAIKGDAIQERHIITSDGDHDESSSSGEDVMITNVEGRNLPRDVISFIHRDIYIVQQDVMKLRAYEGGDTPTIDASDREEYLQAEQRLLWYYKTFPKPRDDAGDYFPGHR